jgi:hypothetical protein
MGNMTNQEKARVARELVVDELRRRGATDVSVTQEGNVFTISASNGRSPRHLTLRVKTKASGDWQTSTTLGDPKREDPAETRFWILVDTGVAAGRPSEYFVVPDWWMTNYIHGEITKHLENHGGRRPVNPGSTHCDVKPQDVGEWRQRWDLLGLT